MGCGTSNTVPSTHDVENLKVFEQPNTRVESCPFISKQTSKKVGDVTHGYIKEETALDPTTAPPKTRNNDLQTLTAYAGTFETAHDIDQNRELTVPVQTASGNLQVCETETTDTLDKLPDRDGYVDNGPIVSNKNGNCERQHTTDSSIQSKHDNCHINTNLLDGSADNKRQEQQEFVQNMYVSATEKGHLKELCSPTELFQTDQNNQQSNGAKTATCASPDGTNKPDTSDTQDLSNTIKVSPDDLEVRARDNTASHDIESIVTDNDNLTPTDILHERIEQKDRGKQQSSELNPPTEYSGMNASTDEDTENMKPLNVETESEDMQVTLRCVSEHEDDDNQAQQYKDIKVSEEQRTKITTMSEDNADSKEDRQKTEENPFEKILFSDTDDKANFELELELEEENALNFLNGTIFLRGVRGNGKQDSFPLPQPPILTKAVIMPDPELLSKVDQHAKKAPDHVSTSLPELVQYLCEPFQDPVCRVRAFFMWIISNISYDTEAFLNDRNIQEDYQSVLRRRSCCCRGFADLMVAMCREVEIPAKTISGFAKGQGYSPEDPESFSRHGVLHAWNSVFIKNNWFLMDCSIPSQKTEQSENHTPDNSPNFEHWFLTEPYKMIYSHFPYMDGNILESRKWQLLKQAVSLEKFNSLVCLSPSAFEFGILPKTHSRQAIILHDGKVELCFQLLSANNCVFTTRLLKRTGKASKKGMRMTYHEVKEERYCTYMFISNDQLKIRVRPPDSKNYILRIYGCKYDGPDIRTFSLCKVFEYKLHCYAYNRTDKNRKYPYPEVLTGALIEECQVLSPLGNPITAKTDLKLRFQSPVLKTIEACMATGKTVFSRNGDIFEGLLKGPVKADSVISIYGSRCEDGSKRRELYQFSVA